MRVAYAVDLVTQKIKLLNAWAKSAVDISNMLKKEVVYLDLNKKNIKEL